MGHQEGGCVLAQSLGHPLLPTQCSATTHSALRHLPLWTWTPLGPSEPHLGKAGTAEDKKPGLHAHAQPCCWGSSEPQLLPGPLRAVLLLFSPKSRREMSERLCKSPGPSRPLWVQFRLNSLPLDSSSLPRFCLRPRAQSHSKDCTLPNEGTTGTAAAGGCVSKPLWFESCL